MKKISLFLLIIVLSGCASVCDAPRNVLGFSKRDLEVVKNNSSYQVYQADYSDVFQAIALIAKENKYYVFTQDEIQGLVILMSIPGVVDTTEVGVFVSRESQGVKVELSSRSTPAKRTVAQVVFTALGEKFKKI